MILIFVTILCPEHRLTSLLEYSNMRAGSLPWPSSSDGPRLRVYILEVLALNYEQ